VAALREGEIEVVGRLIGSSNNAMVAVVRPAGLLAVWKPTRGERPLFDFPIGTLTRREVAAYLVSEALGWAIVPPTILRDGPFGEGSLQAFVEMDPEADVLAMLEAEDPRLRPVALFDAIVNNTDRKGGHLLPVSGGHVYAVDHGVTFSIEPKLRTLLWAWEGQPFEAAERTGLERVAVAFASGALAGELRELLSEAEIRATAGRVDSLLAGGVFPGPNPDWPAIPWPPF
jgi:uncharacterized repeat protein (TIGR03843 family)